MCCPGLEQNFLQRPDLITIVSSTVDHGADRFSVEHIVR